MSKSGRLVSRVQREAEYIYRQAPVYSQRTGQFLFNTLRHEVADVVRGTDLDTFYREMELHEITQWLDDHIIWNNEGTMIAVFDGIDVLWEEGDRGR